MPGIGHHRAGGAALPVSRWLTKCKCLIEGSRFQAAAGSTSRTPPCKRGVPPLAPDNLLEQHVAFFSCSGSMHAGCAARPHPNAARRPAQVKPQYLDSILEALTPHLEPRHLLISIAAGVRIASLEANLPEGTRVVRVMPNTPCLIGQAASAYVLGNHATLEDGGRAYALFSSVGAPRRLPDPPRLPDALSATPCSVAEGSRGRRVQTC